jgi:hypothetical protein
VDQQDRELPDDTIVFDQDPAMWNCCARLPEPMMPEVEAAGETTD